MPRHVELSLNGVSLRSVAPKIWIDQVAEEIDALDMTTAVFPAWDGERQARGVRRALKVTVTARIHQVYDLQARSEALDAIAAWVGAGGILTASYRPGKQLRVIPTRRPFLGKVRDYTQEIETELTAYAVPFWEDATETEATGSGDSGSLTLTLTGTHETPLDAEITAGGAVTTLSLSAGGKTITLTGLSLASGDKVTFEHTEDDFLVIRAGNTRLMDKRTAASADEILLGHGANTVTWEADASVTVAARARGRYE